MKVIDMLEKGGHGKESSHTDQEQGLVRAAIRGACLTKAPYEMLQVRVSCTLVESVGGCQVVGGGN